MASLTRSASLAEHLEASGAKNSSDAAQKLEDEEIETLDDLLTIKPDKLVGMLRELCGMKTGSATKVEAYLEQYRSGGSTQPSGHGMSLCRVNDPIARGIAIGSSGMALGVAGLKKSGEVEAAGAAAMAYAVFAVVSAVLVLIPGVVEVLSSIGTEQ